MKSLKKINESYFIIVSFKKQFLFFKYTLFFFSTLANWVSELVNAHQLFQQLSLNVIHKYIKLFVIHYEMDNFMFY